MQTETKHTPTSALTHSSEPMPKILHAGQLHWVISYSACGNDYWLYIPENDLKSWSFSGSYTEDQYKKATAEHAALCAVAEAGYKLEAFIDSCVTAGLIPRVFDSNTSGNFKQALANLAAIRGGAK